MNGLVRLGCALALSAAATASLAAQQVRVTGASTLRFIELRPLARDSMPAAEVGGAGLLRRLPDGRTVRCLPADEYCRYTSTEDPVSVLPLIHDLSASAWGFARGVRAHVQLRTRSAWGSGAALWPQAEDAADLLAAYAELERDRYRVRAGRQWQVSGLGFYNFDGVNVGGMPVDALWIEAYAGRSLVRGLNESRTGGALASIEDLAPPASGVLAGMTARYRPSSRISLGAAYQLEFRDDGGGLFAELGTADVMWRFRGASIESAVEMDVATRSLNEARIRVRSPPLGRAVLHAEARRYRPYFELWTIWGAFSPVGFDELRGGLSWSDADGSLGVRADASYRSYGDAAVSNPVDVLSGTGWAFSVSADWSPATAWRLDAAYQVETGFGAARRDGHAGITRAFGELATVSVQALAFQRLYEFRLAEGTVYGAAAEAALRVHSRAQLLATGAAYHHGGGSPHRVDWNQRRGSIRLQWTVGAEPAPRLRPGVQP